MLEKGNQITLKENSFLLADIPFISFFSSTLCIFLYSLLWNIGISLNYLHLYWRVLSKFTPTLSLALKNY